MKKQFDFNIQDFQVAQLPGSKSITNRALLMAALAKGRSVLTDCLVSDDSRAFAAALNALGVKVEFESKTAVVEGQGCFPNKKAKVWCQDAGTAARFLCAACAAMPGEYRLDGTPRLCERPLKNLIDVLKQQGASFSQDQMPCDIFGAELKGGVIEVESGASSQFVSALLMIAPLMQSDVMINASGLKRDAYIQLTIEMMREFGVEVRANGFQYQVKAGQLYQARDYVVESDLSAASYFFAKAAVTGKTVLVENIRRDECKQGDVRFLDVLECMGCVVEQREDGVAVTGVAELGGVDVNMNDFSDPFMTLACVAPFAESPTTITGLGHTRLQESDRIAAVAEELTRLNVKVETGEDWIRVYPSEPKAAMVHSHHDHRVAMSLALIGCRVPGIECEEAQAVAKTFPDFFEVF